MTTAIPDRMVPTYTSEPYRPFSRSNRIRSGDSEWLKMQNRVDLWNSYQAGVMEGNRWQPVTPTNPLANASPHSAQPSSPGPEHARAPLHPPGQPAAHTDPKSYFQKYNELSQNIAYRYPDPGPPREKIGRVGGNWRHIKQVLGYGGNQVCFVDGLVRLYEKDMYQPGLASHRQIRTPLYAANRHNVSSYGRILQTEREKHDFQPWEKQTRSSLPALYESPPRSPKKQGSQRLQSPSKYKGFYQMKRENTVG